MESYRGLTGQLTFVSSDPSLGVITLDGDDDGANFVTTDISFIKQALLQTKSEIRVSFTGVRYEGALFATDIDIVNGTSVSIDTYSFGEQVQALSEVREDETVFDDRNRQFPIWSDNSTIDSSAEADETARNVPTLPINSQLHDMQNASTNEAPEATDHMLKEKNLQADRNNPRVLGQYSGNTTVDEMDNITSASDLRVQIAQAAEAASTPNDDLTALTEEQLLTLSFEWYDNPSKLNKETYPFLCCGFVCKDVAKDKILIFTTRLGQIVRDDHPARKGKCYAYFMVVGPDNYKAWSFDNPPPSFKSTKYADSSNVEFKGYGLMAPGYRDQPESTWSVWNDHTGLMKCQSASARTIKKKYDTWEPTLQMIMFDATFNSANNNWMVKTISYIDYNVCTSGRFWPDQAVFIEDLKLNPSSIHAPELEFWSDEIGDKIVGRREHTREMKEMDTTLTYGAVVVPTWPGTTGLSRELRAIVTAPITIWNDNRRERWTRVAQSLYIDNWNEKRKTT